jgi:hypothetical protein
VVGLGLIYWGSFWGGAPELLCVGWGLFFAAIPVGLYFWVVLFRGFRTSTRDAERERSGTET